MKILSLKLLTSNLDILKVFYTQTMELPLIESNSTSFTVKAGTSHLTFEQAPIDEYPLYHFAFDIPSNKVDESIAWLNSKGISLNLLPETTYQSFSKVWNSTSIYFYDPAGNILEFIARHNLNYSLNTAFCAESLINISEIGLIVNDVLSTKELLDRHLSIKGYKNYNPSFAPVGDEQGLFILAAHKRVWFGSNKQGEIYPTEVVIKGDAIKGELILEGYPYTIIAK